MIVLVKQVANLYCISAIRKIFKSEFTQKGYTNKGECSLWKKQSFVASVYYLGHVLGRKKKKKWACHVMVSAYFDHNLRFQNYADLRKIDNLRKNTKREKNHNKQRWHHSSL